MAEVFKVLFVEDEPETVKLARDKLSSTNAYETEVCSFGEFANYATAYDPDIMVLDIVQGGGTSEPETVGLQVYSEVWSTYFRPIIFYTAHTDLIPESAANHPFIERVQKGSGSEYRVLSAAGTFSEQIKALRDAEASFRKEFSYALRDVAPIAFEMFSGAADRERRLKLLVRAGLRRLAALLDYLAQQDERLESWEQYVFPPIGNHYMLGDVIRIKGADVNAVDAYALILTPTCDLVRSATRPPKVSNILVARCLPYPDWLKRVNLASPDNNKGKEALKRVLIAGYQDGIFPLPQLPKRIPQMAANMKDLALIPISDADAKFERVASIDSPFRELISWAYQQIACRTGVPDRDCDKWIEEMIAGAPATNTPSKP